VAFVFLLHDAGISSLVDVRAYPVSRRHPRFSRHALEEALADAGIRYRWEGKALGGMRKGGYLAHMETAVFTAAAQSLIEASHAQRLCIMCAETQPSDCHRSHIADWLVARGERVVHLLEAGKVHEHAARLF
jgi:uncharacterized protein (DUF488 family)